MRASSAVALTICALFCATTLFAEPRAEPIAQFEWHLEYEGFGGISGLEVADDGLAFVAVSDDGVLYRGTFSRDRQGKLQSANLIGSTPLVIETGQRPDPKRYRDMEGLVQTDDGTLHISLEGKPRILSYDTDASTPSAQLLPKVSTSTPKNVGYEAFAISPEGAFLVMREGSRNVRAPFQIFHRDAKGTWRTIFDVPRQGGFRPVGADFGPDGHLYILTRAFNGFGFSVRIERVVYEETIPKRIERLFHGGFGQFDNLEGLAVWRDPKGDIRLIAVSDDNFSRLQSTMFVEFLLEE